MAQEKRRNQRFGKINLEDLDFGTDLAVCSSLVGLLVAPPWPPNQAATAASATMLFGVPRLPRCSEPRTAL